MDAEPLRDRIAAFCVRLSSPSAIAECVRLAVKNHASAIMFVSPSPAALPRQVAVKMRSLPLPALFLSSSAAFEVCLLNPKGVLTSTPELPVDQVDPMHSSAKPSTLNLNPQS